MGAKNSRHQIAKQRPKFSLESCHLAANEYWFPKLNDLPDLALVFDQIISNLNVSLFLISIFSHLPFADRLSAELVCRRWCRLARNGMSWAKYSVLKNSDLQLIANSKPIKRMKVSPDCIMNISNCLDGRFDWTFWQICSKIAFYQIKLY